MSGGNITRAEAAARSSLVHTVSYQVDLDLSRAPVEFGLPTFGSRTTITFGARERGASTWIDLIASRVHRVTLNGVDLDIGGYDGFRIALADLAPSNTLVVAADCLFSHSGEGLHRFQDPADQSTYLYTQFATAEARRVFACFEQPDLKAPLTLEVTAPEPWIVVGNSGDPKCEAHPDATVRWTFPATPPLSTYVVAVVAGPYTGFTDEFQGRFGTYPLRLFARASMAQYLDPPEIFAVTKEGLDFYESAFSYGYPFTKYDQVFVPEFNLGAMENPGAVTFREDSFLFRSRVTDAAHEFRANVILHEMAHMWFGDLVTMRWWDDLWLNESFAEWAGHHVAASATAFTDAWTTFALTGKAWAARADQLPTTHPVSADMVDLEAVYLNFDGITYDKGASVLKQLVAWVGLGAFYEGLRDYFTRHAWGSTTLADLLEALSRASGRSLAQWSRAWLETPGINTLHAVGELDGQGRFTRLVVVQEPPQQPAGVAATIRPHRLALGSYELVRTPGIPDRLVRTLRSEFDLVGVQAEVPDLIGRHQPALLLPNDDDLTYAKVRLDPASLETALERTWQIERPLARALVWGSVWDMVRDAELPMATYLQMILANLGHESKGGLVASVLGTLPDAFTSYLAPESANAAIASFGHAALGWAQAAVPGSDLQLTHANGFIRWAAGPNDLVALAALLGRDGSIPGLRVDQDLRWSIVTRLVAMGADGPELIASELQRDPTMSGQRMAHLARAARPDGAAKWDAWRAATSQDLPNAALEATLEGWGYREHGQLLAPFVAEYFEHIGWLWDNRSPSTGARLARGLFPRTQISPEVLAEAEAYLAAAPPAGLTRIVLEGADAMRRALRCRANRGQVAAGPGTLGP